MTDGSPDPAAGRDGVVRRNPWLPYLLVTLTVLFFAGNSIVGRAVRDDVPPMGLTFWRSVIALAVLLPFVMAPLRRQWPLVRRHWKLIMLLGAAQSAGGQALLYIGLHTTTATNAGVIDGTRPALTIALAWLILRHGITARQGAGLIIALGGALTIIMRGNLQTLLALDIVVGDLWVQLAILNFALYAVFFTRVPKTMTPFVLLVAIVFFSAVSIAPFYAWEILYTDARMTLDGVTLGAIVYTATFSSILAVVFFNIAIAHLGPGRSGVVFYLMPVFTALLAVLLLGETLHGYHLVGTALVFVGLSLGARKVGSAAK